MTWFNCVMNYIRKRETSQVTLSSLNVLSITNSDNIMCCIFPNNMNPYKSFKFYHTLLDANFLVRKIKDPLSPK